MKKSFKIISAFVVLTIMLSLSGCGCKEKPVELNLDLEIWGFLDDNDALAEIFENYKQINPSVKSITYRKLAINTYKDELIEALASGQGPDIFMIHNSWTFGFLNKAFPAPEDMISEIDYGNNFVDVCMDDFFVEGRAFAVPLSVDSIGLYYNKDIFNAAGITFPPKTWSEFVDYSRRMTKVSSTGEIIQSGAAMGTADNINRPTDILNLLMMQNGIEVIDESGKANLSGGGATDALAFYTQFAKTDSASYSWNNRMHYSLDAFAEGNVAMMLNYSWQTAAIRDKSPKLNFSVTEVPQISLDAPKNFANYWGYTVSKNKFTNAVASNGMMVNNEMRIIEAWKFLMYLTMKTNMASASGAQSSLGNKVDLSMEPAFIYLSKTNQPAARRDLVEMQISNAELGPFAKGNLIAKSWIQVNPESVEVIFHEMINSVNIGEYDPRAALLNAADKINQAAGM